MNYPNAPIQEALFDIRVDQLNIAQIEDLAKFKDYVKEIFPNEKKQHNFIGQFQLSPDKPFQGVAQTDLAGYIYSSIDGTRQLQIKADGITLNILKPYENWDTHFKLFIKMWSEYEKLYSPNKIVRIATRFINRIELPLPFNSFQDYIVNMPPIPKCLPQHFASFLMQIQVPCHDRLKSAIITETIEPASNSILPFILDIDVFQELGLSNSKEDLEIKFSELRQAKNEIFESCITEKTKALFI